MSVSSRETEIRAAINDNNKSLRTAIPGVIDAFDPSTQMARVSISIKTLLIDGRELQLPELLGVPVQFVRGGGFSFTQPVRRGDECLVVFADRSIDLWKKEGAGRCPAHARDHNLSDGIALVGLSSQKNVIPNFDPANCELKSDDGKISIKLFPSGAVTINSNGAIISVGAGKDITLQNDGASFTLANGGAAVLNASSFTVNVGLTTFNGDVKVEGELDVSGEITDLSDSPGNSSLSALRAAYNAHTHVGNGAGNNTSGPSLPYQCYLRKNRENIL